MNLTGYHNRDGHVLNLQHIKLIRATLDDTFGQYLAEAQPKSLMLGGFVNRSYYYLLNCMVESRYEGLEGIKIDQFENENRIIPYSTIADILRI